MLFYMYAKQLQDMVADSKLNPSTALKKLLRDFLANNGCSISVFNDNHNQDRHQAIQWLKLLETNSTAAVIDEYKHMVEAKKIPQASPLRYCILLYLTLFPGELHCATPPSFVEQEITRELLSGKAVFDYTAELAIEGAVAAAPASKFALSYFQRKTFYNIVENLPSLIPLNLMIHVIDRLLEAQFTDQFGSHPFTKEASNAVISLAPFLPPEGLSYITTELCSTITNNILDTVITGETCEYANRCLSILAAFAPFIPKANYKNVQRVVDLILSRRDKPDFAAYKPTYGVLLGYMPHLNNIITIPEPNRETCTIQPAAKTVQLSLELDLAGASPPFAAGQFAKLEKSLLLLIDTLRYSDSNRDAIKNIMYWLAKVYPKIEANARNDYENTVLKLMFSLGVSADISNVFFNEIAKSGCLSPRAVQQIINHFTHCKSNKVYDLEMIAQFAPFLPSSEQAVLANLIFENITQENNVGFYFNYNWPVYVTQLFAHVSQLTLFKFMNTCVNKTASAEDISISYSYCLSNFRELLSHQQRVFLMGRLKPCNVVATFNFLQLFQDVQHVMKVALTSEHVTKEVLVSSAEP